MRPRWAWAAAVAAAAVLTLPAVASAHAVLLSASPAPDARLATAPQTVTLHFNEPVQLLSADSLTVVDGRGRAVGAAPAALDPGDARTATIRLRAGLPRGTYTVRYLVISADSHVVGGAYVFGVGPGELAPPFLGGAGETGPSETGAWAVSARFLELVGLGGLLGLMAFRWLVWRPAWRASRVGGGRGAAEIAGLERDTFWTWFSLLAIGAMLAEAYLLVVKSASALRLGVLDVVRRPDDVSTVLGSTHFGSLVQSRAALLFVLFALGAWQFTLESSARSERQGTSATLRHRVPAAVMGALALAAITLVSWQGHASQAPYPALQVGADVLHFAGAAIWIAGLALLTASLVRLPRSGRDGQTLSAHLLARFSLVATAAVALVIVTGVVRSAAELSDPAQLWDTSYGRSIIYKLLLLVPAGCLALRNRRVVTALRGVDVPTRATIRMVRRAVAAELVVALAIVVVASVLVAQVPGRV